MDNPRHRYEFIQKIVDNFWGRWTRDYFPSLIIQQNGTRRKQILKKGDIVLIQDSNQIRGQWKLGKVSEVFPGEDGIVRNTWHTRILRKGNRLMNIMAEDTLQSKDQFTD